MQVSGWVKRKGMVLILEGIRLLSKTVVTSLLLMKRRCVNYTVVQEIWAAIQIWSCSIVLQFHRVESSSSVKINERHFDKLSFDTSSSRSVHTVNRWISQNPKTWWNNSDIIMQWYSNLFNGAGLESWKIDINLILKNHGSRTEHTMAFVC
jgi:hypothetical protein